MNEVTPPLDTWRSLYQAAIDFKQLACWRWMYDSDIFGVQNPETGEIGYCCVMGMLGEHYALGVYLGMKGLEGYSRMRSGELNPPDATVLHLQKCLMASYEDRNYLHKEDLAVIKQLGLKFRGRNAWPCFRSYRPGYFPWFVTDAEARFLTLALQQTIQVGQRFKETPDLLEPPGEGLYLVRVPEQHGAEWHWTDQWLPPEEEASQGISVPSFDEIRVERIKRSITRRRDSWETDFFLSPEAVREDDRPYFPYLILWVDHASGMILMPHLSTPTDYQAALQSSLLDLIEQAQWLPRELYVLQQEAYVLLAPIAERLQIKLRLARSLPAIEAARDGLMNFFLARG